ncbi:hypothetical protein, partial [Bacillus thuringiensis]|uniref:hypothetical protein n=1 Tax=Bacillus thuringiensis TaxID=1428 RepID=UPI001D0BED26
LNQDAITALLIECEKIENANFYYPIRGTTNRYQANSTKSPLKCKNTLLSSEQFYTFRIIVK